MKLKTLGPRVDTVSHPTHPEVKARVRIPDQVELAKIQLTLDPFREKTYLTDPKTGKYFRDKKERPFYEINLDMRKATEKILEILDQQIEGFEGLDLEAADQDARPSKIACAPELEYMTIEAIQEEGGHEWTDPSDGNQLLYVRWNEKEDKPIMRNVHHVWGVDLFWRILDPPIYKDSDEGKGLPTPTT